jgi:hypothetical protein
MQHTHPSRRSSSMPPRSVTSAVLTCALLVGCGGSGDSTATGPSLPPTSPAPQVFCTTEVIPLCSSPDVGVRVLSAVEDASVRSLPALADTSSRATLRLTLTAMRTAISTRNITVLRSSTGQAMQWLNTSMASPSADLPELSAIQLAVIQAVRLLDTSN